MWCTVSLVPNWWFSFLFCKKKKILSCAPFVASPNLLYTHKIQSNLCLATRKLMLVIFNDVQFLLGMHTVSCLWNKMTYTFSLLCQKEIRNLRLLLQRENLKAESVCIIKMKLKNLLLYIFLWSNRNSCLHFISDVTFTGCWLTSSHSIGYAMCLCVYGV